MNKRLALLTALLCILSACTTRPKEEVTSTPTGTTATLETVEPVETIEPVEPVEPTFTEKDVLKILRKSYEGSGVIDYSESQHTFILTPNALEFAESIAYVLDTGDTTEWNVLKQTYAELSIEISNTLNDDTVSLAIANPVNLDSLLLIVSDGEVLYDGVTEALGY